MEYPLGVSSSAKLGPGVTVNVCRPKAGFYLADVVLFKKSKFQFITVPTIPFSFHLYALLIRVTCRVSADGSRRPFGPWTSPHSVSLPWLSLPLGVVIVTTLAVVCSWRLSHLRWLHPWVPSAASSTQTSPRFARAKFNCSCFIRRLGIFSHRGIGCLSWKLLRAAGQGSDPMF